MAESKELKQLRIDYSILKNKIHKLQSLLEKNTIPNNQRTLVQIQVDSMKSLLGIIYMRLNKMEIEEKTIDFDY